MKIAVRVALCFLLLSGLVQAQDVAPLSGPLMPLPAQLTETECQADQCAAASNQATWEFHGLLGDAQWYDGSSATLVIERYDAAGIVIRRIDLPNSASYGLTAVYKGKLQGDRIPPDTGRQSSRVQLSRRRAFSSPRFLLPSPNARTTNVLPAARGDVFGYCTDRKANSGATTERSPSSPSYSSIPTESSYSVPKCQRASVTGSRRSIPAR